MNIVIDNFDFLNMEAQKYWSFPSSYDANRRKTEAKSMTISGEYIGARKMDGAWEMIIKDNEGNFYARSRTESVNGGYVNKAEWIPHIIKELDAVPNGTVLVGEIYFPNNEGSRKVTSVFNCLKDKCIERQKKNGYLHFYIFDVLAYKGKSLLSTPINNRINRYLEYELLDVLRGDYLDIADYKEGQELWDMYGDIIANGGEGIVITKKTAPYAPGKRTARMTLKMKKELTDTIDAFLDGGYKAPTKEYSGKEIETWPYWLNEKTGQKFNTCKYDEFLQGAALTPITKPYYYGWASAVSFSVMKDGQPVHIAYISGITDELKAGIISEPDKWRGKVYELSCMEIENTGISETGYSLRHAKIIGERKDKEPKDCDISQIIKQ